MNGVLLALLAIFSGLSVNLVFQTGLGIRKFAGGREPDRFFMLVQMGIILAAVLPLWFVFSKISAVFSPGFFLYLLAFPASSFVYYALEHLFRRFVLKDNGGPGEGFCDGFAAAALFICLGVAGTFVEAAVLSLGFTAGIMLAFLILGEIRRRSMLEAVPKYLRGGPLVLVSLGLLSLICSSAASLFYVLLGVQ
jgi:electron transport complex protein RnfA